MLEFWREITKKDYLVLCSYSNKVQNTFIPLCCTIYKIPKNIADVHVWKKVWTMSEEEKYLVQLVCLVDIFGGL